MFTDPVGFIRGGIPSPQSQARSSGSQQPSQIIAGIRAAIDARNSGI